MIPVASRPVSFVMGLGVLTLPFLYWTGLYDFILWPRLFLLQTLLLAGIVLWWMETPRLVSVGPFPCTLPLIAMACLTVLSIFWTINPIEGLIQASKTFTFLLLTLLVMYALPAKAIPRLYMLAALSGAIVSLVGIAQYFGKDIVLPGWQLSKIPSIGNPSATFGYRNFAATYLAVSIPFTILFAWTSKKTWARLGWTLSTSLMALFLIYTRTRGAWVGLGGALFVAACVLIFLRLRTNTPGALIRSRSFLLLLGCCFLLVAIVSTRQHQMQQEGKFRFDERKTDALTTLSTTFSPSDARGRLTVWKHTLEMVWDYPLLGVGLGSWQYQYPRYDKGDWITHKVSPQRPHNDFLWILSETGLLGLGTFLWLLGILAQTIWKALRLHGHRPEALWMFGIAVGLLAFVGHSCFSFPKERIAPSFMFWFGLGALCRLSAELEGQPERASNKKRALFLGLSLLPLAGALILTYQQIQFDGHYLRTYGAWRQERWEQVVERADHALTWGPFNHRVLLLKAFSLHKLGNLQQAAETYQAAMRYHPNDGHAALAAVYADLGKHNQALTHYQTEYKLYPTAFRVALDLAKAYETLRQWDQAARIYHKQIALNPTSDLYTGLARSLQMTDNIKGATEAYQQALRLTPEDPHTYNNLGALLVRQSRFREAEQAYNRALQIRPDYARVYHNLGDLYAGWDKSSRAIASYQRFLLIWKGEPRFLDLVRQKIKSLTP